MINVNSLNDPLFRKHFNFNCRKCKNSNFDIEEVTIKYLNKKYENYAKEIAPDVFNYIKKYFKKFYVRIFDENEYKIIDFVVDAKNEIPQHIYDYLATKSTDKVLFSIRI